jgi:ATP-dependent DNA helicase RecG
VPRPPRDDGLLAAFDATLPYELTDGQRRVGAEIAGDLARPHPMHRLLQGEVGSGKTLCALRAMLQVVDAGGQAAILAPTEVLAAQHHRSLSALLGPYARAGELDGAPDGTRIALVTGSLGAAARRSAAAEVASGAAGIVVGTHALLYDGVDFADLGLIVVDEQHRFGVEQRDALRAKADQPPHVLVMTATPIPRTVAMTVYGDLEISTLNQLPRGRSPIASHVVPAAEKPAFLDRAWRRLREEVGKGHQAYVVCPRIGDTAAEESDPGDAGAPAAEGRRPPLAVLDVAPLLADGPLTGLRIGILHGRLPAEEKDAVMRTFAAGDLDVLVATTVIEVGVDVPNATMMVIMDADRFGVSQLHQLRGRVGRGSAPGLCLLVSEAMAGTPARERLDAVASTQDGFRLAELDLEQRREGDVLGASQSGRRSHLRLLSLLRDTTLIREARVAATALIDDDPELDKHPELAAAVARLVDDERAEYLEKG